MPAAIVLRDSTPADRDAVFRLHEKLFREEIEERWGWDDQKQFENFLQEWDEHSFTTVLVEGEIIGYAQTSEEADHIYLHSIGFLHEFRRRGLGKEILSGVLTEAEALGKSVKLSVSPRNLAAIQMYSAFGFEVTSSTESSLQMAK